MKKNFHIIFFCCISATCTAQDSILRAMINKSVIIAEVHVLGTGPGWSDLNKYDMTVYTRIKSVYKGKIKTGDTLLFSITLQSYAEKDSAGKFKSEELNIKEGSDYIIFLSSKNGKAQYGKEIPVKDSTQVKTYNGIRFSNAKYFTIYNLTDKWLGIIAADYDIAFHLRSLLSSKQ